MRHPDRIRACLGRCEKKTPTWTGAIRINARKGAGSAMRPAFATRLVVAATLAGSGYIHTQLYLAGYRFIHIVGVLFKAERAGDIGRVSVRLHFHRDRFAGFELKLSARRRRRCT